MSNTDYPERQNRWTGYEIVSLVVSGIGIIVVAVYTYYAREQVKETREANGIAQQALFFANRPYVMWDTYVTNQTSELSGKTEWRISASVHNFGKTPAIDVVGKICDPIIRQDINQPSFKNCPISENIDRLTIVGPEQTTNITGPALSDEEFTAVSRGQRLLYIYGDIRYSDGVSHKTWATRFCHQVQITLVQLPMGVVRERVFTLGCHDKNWTCVDEACPPQP